MTAPQLEPEVVQRRLRELRVQLDRLDELGEVDAERLRGDWILAAAVERVLTTLVELALDVNAHVAVADGRLPPEDYRTSFFRAADAGWLAHELAERLAPSAGMRNVLVHRYLDIDYEQVATAVRAARSAYREYVRALSQELRRRVAQDADGGSFPR